MAKYCIKAIYLSKVQREKKAWKDHHSVIRLKNPFLGKPISILYELECTKEKQIIRNITFWIAVRDLNKTLHAIQKRKKNQSFSHGIRDRRFFCFSFLCHYLYFGLNCQKNQELHGFQQKKKIQMVKLKNCVLELFSMSSLVLLVEVP